MRSFLFLIQISLITLVLCSRCPFNLQSGDVTQTTAIIQASLLSPLCRPPASTLTTISVTVSLDTNFQQIILNSSSRVLPFSGIDPREQPGAYVSKIYLSSLQPATRYYYRFTAETGAVSELGSFITLQSSKYTGPFTFLHMSCANENPYPISSSLYHFTTTKRPNFALFNGDVVYADRFWVPKNATFDSINRCCNQPQTSLSYFRSLYADQRDESYTGKGFPQTLRSLPIFSVWDDHAINDNYAGQDSDPRRVADILPMANITLADKTPKREIEAQYLFGYQAFFEMNAITPGRQLQAQDPAPGLARPERRLFRKVRPGRDVEIFILDLRQYRDAPVPSIGRLPVLPLGLTEEVLCSNPSTAPLCEQLPQPVVNQKNFRDQNVTMLGKAQKAWLKKSLRESTAKFKIIVSSVQILEWYLAPSDRWEGYWIERKEILSFIENEQIKNMVFLAGDVHASIFSRLNPGKSPAIHEFSTGPIGRSTFASASAPFGDMIAQFIVKFGGNAHVVGEPAVKFINIDVTNFMSVDYKDSSLTVRCIGPDGKVVIDKFGNSGEFVLQAEN